MPKTNNDFGDIELVGLPKLPIIKEAPEEEEKAEKKEQDTKKKEQATKVNNIVRAAYPVSKTFKLSSPSTWLASLNNLTKRRILGVAMVINRATKGILLGNFVAERCYKGVTAENKEDNALKEKKNLVEKLKDLKTRVDQHVNSKEAKKAKNLTKANVAFSAVLAVAGTIAIAVLTGGAALLPAVAIFGATLLAIKAVKVKLQNNRVKDVKECAEAMGNLLEDKIELLNKKMQLEVLQAIDPEFSKSKIDDLSASIARDDQKLRTTAALTQENLSSKGAKELTEILGLPQKPGQKEEELLKNLLTHHGIDHGIEAEKREKHEVKSTTNNSAPEAQKGEFEKREEEREKSKNQAQLQI